MVTMKMDALCLTANNGGSSPACFGSRLARHAPCGQLLLEVVCKVCRRLRPWWINMPITENSNDRFFDGGK